jgi:hypothetical protein
MPVEVNAGLDCPNWSTVRSLVARPTMPPTKYGTDVMSESRREAPTRLHQPANGAGGACHVDVGAAPSGAPGYGDGYGVDPYGADGAS